MDINTDILNADLDYRRERLIADLGSRTQGSRTQGVRRTGLRRLLAERRARRDALARGVDPADLITRA